MKRIFLCLGLMWGLTASAQVFIQNTLYSFNRFVYNPAAAGINQSANLTLLGRLQWVGIDGGPRSFTAAVDAPITSMQSGVGAYIIGDELGPLSTVGVNVSYAYHLDVGNATLSIGASGGLLQKSINGNFVYDRSNGDDPVVPFGNYSSSAMVPNLAAGIYFTLPEDKFFIGISGQDLLEPSIEELTLTAGIGPDAKVTRTFYLSSGIRFDLSDQVNLQPSVLARTDGISTQFDASVLATLKSVVVLGVSHRFYNDSFSGIIGAKISNKLFFGYAYDYTLSGLNANRDLASHEIMLTYSFSGGGGIPFGKDNVIKKTRQ